MDGYGRHGVVAAHINTLDRTLSDKLASFDTEYERWRTGQVELQQLERQVAHERDELHRAAAALSEDEARLEGEIRERWRLPTGRDSQRRVRLNVGGQLFETSAEVLTRDRFSMLAGLCVASCPVPQPCFIDRDWWLFRHILAFLRDGPTALPDSPDVLRQLYAESSFYRLHDMRTAIEGRLQGLRSVEGAIPAGPYRGVASRAEDAIRWSREGRSTLAVPPELRHPVTMADAVHIDEYMFRDAVIGSTRTPSYSGLYEPSIRPRRRSTSASYRSSSNGSSYSSRIHSIPATVPGELPDPYGFTYKGRRQIEARRRAPHLSASQGDFPVLHPGLWH